MKHVLDELFGITKSRLESAQKRFTGAQDDYMKRYYKGQVDTLRMVLHDIKFELGLELHEDISPTSQRTDTLEAQEQPPAVSQSVSQEPKKHKSQKNEKSQNSKKSKKKEPPESPCKPLAHAAIKKGIIEQRSSHFLHPSFPGGRVQGFPQLYKALEDDEKLRQAIQAALQETAVPDEAQSDEAQSDEALSDEAQSPAA
jgi:hypothetical protein